MKIYDETGEVTNFKLIVNQFKDNLTSIEAGQRILISDTNKINLAAKIIACFEKGLVIVPISPITPKQTIEFLYKHSEACGSFFNSNIEINGKKNPSPAQHRVIVYTSGTTGNPKGVMLSEQNLLSNASAVSKLHNFKNSTHASPLPLFHVNAMCMSLFGTYVSDSSLIIINSLDPMIIFDICNKFEAETLNLVPTLISRLIESNPPWPKKLKYILSAAAPLNQRITSKFYSLYGNRLRQGYGLSEATNFSFTMPSLDNDSFLKHMVESYPPVGLPIEGTSFTIIDEEVHVNGPNIFMGYWNNPKATNQAYNGLWLKTGDLGEMRDGYLVLKGRRKEIILKGGETIYPADLEDSYSKVGIEGAIAFGVPNEDLGEEIGLAFDTYQDPNLLMSNISKIEKHIQPSCCLVCTIPRTSTGKVQRKKLSQVTESGYIADTFDSIINSNISKIEMEIHTGLIKLAERIIQKSSYLSSDTKIIDLCFHPTNKIANILKTELPQQDSLYLITHFNNSQGWKELQMQSISRKKIAEEFYDVIKNKSWGWIKLRYGRFDVGGIFLIGDLSKAI